MRSLVRQALLAALGLAPTLALAEVGARYENGVITVTGLEPAARTELAARPEQIILQVADLASDRGMPISVGALDGDLRIEPYFSLRAGNAYSLRLGSSGELKLTLPVPDAPAPMLIGFEPAQAVIPANALRMYLHFSAPMARGQVRDAVALMRADGSPVQSPFLALEAELWDPTQKRVTLLFDPGRIKQGVGPNLEAGAPLEAGQSYRLLIDGDMKSTDGVPIGSDVSVAFRVGPAERRPLSPETWQILVPPPESQAPLTLAFDRIIDTGAARRLIAVHDPKGTTVRGHIETDGGGWSLTPSKPWVAGTYNVVVDPELEDVSGNALGVPFDASAGTIGTVQDPVTLPVEIISAGR